MSSPSSSRIDSFVELRPATDGEQVVLPPDDLEVLLDLASFLDGHPAPGVLVSPDGEQRELPAEVYAVIAQVVEVMRRGQAILIAPQGMVLTTQEAADFLGVSRPTLVRLLETGAIPFDKPNRHRRVLLHDLISYQTLRRRERLDILNRITQESGENGIYEGTSADYADALRAARKHFGASSDAL